MVTSGWMTYTTHKLTVEGSSFPTLLHPGWSVEVQNVYAREYYRRGVLMSSVINLTR